LARYISWPEGNLERLEGLEQLRLLEYGVKIRCVLVDAKGCVFWELNNPVDVARIENVLQGKGWP
jgi:3-deoxy-manno-octulosonate cytidylyltransferase (CMP-KDO synthetase)